MERSCGRGATLARPPSVVGNDPVRCLSAIAVRFQPRQWATDRPSEKRALRPPPVAPPLQIRSHESTWHDAYSARCGKSNLRHRR